ncbi:hypothetical protein, partial [Acinetobacter sp. Tr-809]|uniref:hypothetical protein n=1 Tax=Acinetobacter sp. Tr-809 TaxID=2608324 RepID=UPI00141EB789
IDIISVIHAIAVWRGYNGVNNRNYIDPNLIAGIEVIKGPSLERNTTTSVGRSEARRVGKALLRRRRSRWCP